MDIQQIATAVIDAEASAVKNLKKYINDDFEKTVRTLLQCKGRFVITGIGKSAIIAQKIVATLNSTGTAALFMHAADAIHGDLGLLQKGDIAMAISKSGESPEIRALVPIIKARKIPLIAMVGAPKSTLARAGDFMLLTEVTREACPHNLAPTTSTTAQLAMGDALAMCLMQCKNFTPADFARHHPGGFLGKNLLLTLRDFCNVELAHASSIRADDTLEKVIVAISKSRMGAAVIVNKKSQIEGIITDGDLRRTLAKKIDIHRAHAKDIMSKNPITLTSNTLAADAFQRMRDKKINQILITDKKGIYLGMVHLQELIKEGF